MRHRRSWEVFFGGWHTLISGIWLIYLVYDFIYIPQSPAELSSVSLNTYLSLLFLPSSLPPTFVICLLRVDSYLLFDLPRWTRNREFSGVTREWQCSNLGQNSKMEVSMKCYEKRTEEIYNWVQRMEEWWGILHSRDEIPLIWKKFLIVFYLLHCYMVNFIGQ